MHTFERNCSFGLNIRYAECSNRGLGVSRSKIRKAYVLSPSSHLTSILQPVGFNLLAPEIHDDQKWVVISITPIPSLSLGPPFIYPRWEPRQPFLIHFPFFNFSISPNSSSYLAHVLFTKAPGLSRNNLQYSGSFCVLSPKGSFQNTASCFSCTTVKTLWWRE